MIFEGDPGHVRTMNRLNACLFTTRCTLSELADPKDTELRADLLIASDALLNDVMRLNDKIREMVWSDLDRNAHPSSSHDM